MTEKKSTSPWMWIGCGCGLVLLLIVVAIAGAGFFAAKTAKEFGEAMVDPVAREAKAIEILGGNELPPGFHAMISLSAPLGLFDLVLLSDLPGDDSGEPQDFGDAGLIYYRTRGGMGMDMEEVRDYFDGTSDDSSVLSDNNINLRVDEILGRGTVERPDLDLMWVAHRGKVRSMGNSSDDAVTSIFLFDCPGDKKVRMAIWFENQDGSGASASADADAAANVDTRSEDRDYSGTPADPAEIERFAEYFHPCPVG